MSNSGAWPLSAEKAVREPEPATRLVNMNRLGSALLSARPPVELLFVYNANPLATLPAQEKVRAGLAREDLFTVVFDQVMTDTARYADVLFPATTFLEHAELSRGYGAIALQRTTPAIAPVGEARPNHAVFLDLCRRTGVARPDDPEDIEAFEDALLASRGGNPEVREALGRSGIAFPATGFLPVQFVDEFPRTSDRKVHLCPETLDREAPLGLYGYQDDPATSDYPLALISPATEKTVNSTLGQLDKRQAALEIHPSDAAARGIADGDAVRVYNALGEVRCRAEVNPHLRPGVASLAKGLWSHSTLNGATSNALVPDTLTDLGGGACFNDARVQVERAG